MNPLLYYFIKHWYVHMLNFATCVWCPFKLDNIKDSEKIQKRATKLIQRPFNGL